MGVKGERTSGSNGGALYSFFTPILTVLNISPKKPKLFFVNINLITSLKDNFSIRLLLLFIQIVL